MAASLSFFFSSITGRATFFFTGPRLPRNRVDLGCRLARPINRRTERHTDSRKGEKRVKKEKRVPFSRSVRLHHLLTPFRVRVHQPTRTCIYITRTHELSRFQDRGYDRVILSTLRIPHNCSLIILLFSIIFLFLPFFFQDRGI